ncbi:MAG: fibronectin type III domain-containing protein, partial [Acidimicrobiia bacterium]|nr:fibronectin type III domain-containing protein [Acidimicrobiia bacterium]
HMDSIAAPDGALVTPATKIGEIGDKSLACNGSGTVNYLHFEVVHNGMHGDRVNPGQLKACINGRTIRLPRAIGYDGWNQVPYRLIGLPRTDSSCVPGSFATPARPSGVRARIGNEQVAVSWSLPPSGVSKVMIAVADYRPSRGVWSGWTYKRLDDSTSSYTYRNLYNGHPYRFKVAFHGADGYSRWAGTPTVEPAGTPLAPRYRWARVTKTTLEMCWYRSERRGTPVTGYQVAYRQDLGSRWSSWHVTRIDPMGRHTWTDLRSRTRFEVKVRGMSAVGPSPWSQIGSATTNR